MLDTPWVMMGEARRRRCNITYHEFSNMGWKSSLLAASRLDHMGLRRSGCATCAYHVSTSKNCRKITAGGLDNSLIVTVSCMTRSEVVSDLGGLCRSGNVATK